MSQIKGNKSAGSTTGWFSDGTAVNLFPTAHQAVAGDAIRRMGYRKNDDQDSIRYIALYGNTTNQLEGATLRYSDFHFPKVIEVVSDPNEAELEFVDVDLRLVVGDYYWFGVRFGSGYYQGDGTSVSLARLTTDGTIPDPAPTPTADGPAADLWAEVVNTNETVIQTLGTPSTDLTALTAFMVDGHAITGAEIEYYTITDEHLGAVTVTDTGHWSIDRRGKQTIKFRSRPDPGSSWSNWIELLIDDLTDYQDYGLRSVDVL